MKLLCFKCMYFPEGREDFTGSIMGLPAHTGTYGALIYRLVTDDPLMFSISSESQKSWESGRNYWKNRELNCIPASHQIMCPEHEVRNCMLL